MARRVPLRQIRKRTDNKSVSVGMVERNIKKCGGVAEYVNEASELSFDYRDINIGHMAMGHACIHRYMFLSGMEVP